MIRLYIQVQHFNTLNFVLFVCVKLVLLLPGAEMKFIRKWRCVSKHTKCDEEARARDLGNGSALPIAGFCRLSTTFKPSRK